jgi:hypothetical protein
MAMAGTLRGEPAAAPERVLTGWGGRKAQQTVPAAAAIGVRQIVVHHDQAEEFTQFIELGQKHGINVFAWLTLSDVKVWKQDRPGEEPPLQVMTAEEDDAVRQINAMATRDRAPYQWGGEPVMPREALLSELLCFHDERVPAFFKRQIEQMLSFPGVAGVALDFIGYRNYRCCHCPRSQELADAFARAHPQLSSEQALEAFSLQSLVAFSNELTAHVRAINPKARVITHVYPVYLPRPLYGNLLDVDECGQTAAWFFQPFWSLDKVRQYTQVIVGEEAKHFPHARGAALLGYYAWTGKTAARVGEELDAILAAGCTRVQVCDLAGVLANPDVAAEFARRFVASKPAP